MTALQGPLVSTTNVTTSSVAIYTVPTASQQLGALVVTNAGTATVYVGWESGGATSVASMRIPAGATNIMIGLATNVGNPGVTGATLSSIALQGTSAVNVGYASNLSVI